ncbi:MAG: hypothetical protein LC776_14355 [Acidobacteria bacterium]|nr:hypothetical protein [Acidobacteriota bacterium]
MKVNAVYDTEETKSTGLANRLLAEKNNPQADVFWSNEPVRTLALKNRGVLAPYKSSSAVGIPDVFKARKVSVVNILLDTDHDCREAFWSTACTRY